LLFYLLILLFPIIKPGNLFPDLFFVNLGIKSHGFCGIGHVKGVQVFVELIPDIGQIAFKKPSSSRLQLSINRLIILTGLSSGIISSREEEIKTI